MDTNKQGSPKTFKYFIQLLKLGKPSKWLFALALFLSLLETAAGLIVPLFTKILVDQIATAGIELKIVFLLLVVFIIQTVSGGFSFYLMTYIGETFVKNIRQKLWDHILDLPIPYFDQHQSGETMSRVTQDTNIIKALITNHFVTFISGIISIIGAIFILLLIDWKMTVIMLVSAPVAMLILLPLGRKMYKISKETQDEMAAYSANLGRVLNDIRLVKSSNGQAKERKRGKKRIVALFRYGLKEAKVQAVVSPLMTTVMMLVLVILIGYGGARVSTGELSAGSLVAVIIYMFQIIIPFTQLASFFTSFQKAMGATEKIQQLLHIEGEDNKQVKKEIQTDQTLHFQDVSFAYERGKPVLKALDFTIQPGQTVAFVGPSGSGKTTIFSLIERFYQPTAGRILLGDTDIQDLPLQEWRKAIGYVSQDSPIMSGTIKDNICYGLDRPVKEDEIKHVAQLANATSFIEKLPHKYDTEVGEHGLRLSGGQRQRIAIARALLRNPTLLLLDEATSNLDSASENLVQHALKSLMANRTTLVIAHRLATILEVDNIIVIENGMISGQGTHQTLMKQHPLYRKFVQQQMKMKDSHSTSSLC